MTPVSQKLLISASDGTVHTGVSLASTNSLTKVTGLPSTVGAFNIVWGYDKFVAQSVTNPEYIYYSSDGAAWTKAPISTVDVKTIQVQFGNAVRLFYVGGYWISTMWGGFLTSADGISWVVHRIGTDATNMANVTTDAVYRPETSTWFINCSNGDMMYCTQPAPNTLSNWVKKPTAVPTTIWSMAYGWDQTLLQNVFIAMVSGGIYRSLDGYNWTKGVGTISSTVNQVRFIRTNDPTQYSVWAYVGASVGTTPIVFGIATSPYGSGFNNSRSLTVYGRGADIDWDDTNFSVIGYRISGTSHFPLLQTINENLTGSFVGASPGGSFPVVNGVDTTSVAVYLPDTAPTSIIPTAGTGVTTPGPVLGATLARTSSTDFQIPQWQIDTVSTFDSPNLRTVNNPVIAGYSGAQTYTLPPGQALTADGTYYIRARSITFDGPLSPWSAATSFTVTIPPIPAPTAPVATVLTDYWPTFSATQSAYGGGASKLEFQYATDAGFTNVISSYMQPDSNYITSAGSNPSPYRNPNTSFVFSAGTYYFRARQWSIFGLVSPWSTGASFTTNPTLPVLQGTGVASGSYPAGSKKVTAPIGTVGSSYPTVSWLAGTLTNMSNYPRNIHMQIQTASDSGFTTNLTTTDGATITFPIGSNSSGSVYISTRITPGTVYVRGLLSDDFGLRSTTYLDTSTFSISHPPTSLPATPANGALINYDTNGQVFTWQFQDPSPGDTQTAYEIVVTKISDGSTVYDSGKVASTTSSCQTVIATNLKGIALGWVVRSWDTDDNPGPYSKIQTVTFLDPPVLTITAPPANGTVTTGRPTISWTLGGTAPQRVGVVTVIDQATNKVVYSSKNPTNAQSLTPAQNVLENTHTYFLKIDVLTTLGQAVTASEVFTASYVPPATPVYTVDASGYDQLGYIDVNWGSTTPDSYFFTWTVWRRVLGTDNWVQLFVTTNPAIIDYQDWSAITGVYYEYMVSQDADRSGVLLGSSLGNPNPAVIATSGGWWFIDPTNNANNFYVNVTEDSFTDEFEENSFVIVGRGRAKDVGTHLGLTGSVTATIRPSYSLTAKQRLDTLRAMRRQNKRIMLRDPFGNYYYMTIGNIQISHMAGVGSLEMYDVTIPLDEVII